MFPFLSTHRDLKSANILVCNDSGVCVIADLGFAMILDPLAGVKELANTGQVCFKSWFDTYLIV